MKTSRAMRTAARSSRGSHRHALLVVAGVSAVLVACGGGEPEDVDLASSAVDDDPSGREAASGERGERATGTFDAGPARPVTDVDASASAGPTTYAVGTTLRTTADLNLRAGAGTQHGIVVTMPAGAIVAVVAAAPDAGFYNVRYASLTGWASGDFLVPAPGAKVDDFPQQRVITPVPVRPHVQAFANVSCGTIGCPDNVSSYNGHSPSVELALDVFQLRERGDRYAEFGVADKVHRVDYVIWRQRINSRDGRGWRMMEDRGSITANHYDHVHVSFDP
jgi:uncharacterized protein YraI